MTDSYFHVRLENVATEDEELVSQLCFDHGAQGVSEQLQFQQTRDDYQPEIVETERKTLEAFFLEPPGEEFFLRMASRYPEVKIEHRRERNKDWLAEWKKSYKPFQLAGPYWVVPTWLEKPAAAEKPVWIDPGMAFGTGTHATTRMVAKMIYAQTLNRPPGFSLLDVGTGTGILAFLAKLQGAGRAVGTEIDPEARRVVRENIELNRLQGIEIPELQIEDLNENFDLVVANIIESVLLKLKEHLLGRLKPGGRLILSGILLENERSFLRSFLAGTRLKVIERLQDEEWLGLVLGE